MTQVINTNVLSLNAQRNLATSGSALSTALQRLSSGLRINSSKDDAAGLAIAERFTTQIRGLNQAARNANDGISLAQTGEGALAEITSNLQRIRELSVQAANSTNSTSDRGAIDQEVQQRLAEIQRVSSQTSFNGQKILDGSFGNAAFQVGANAGETISIDLTTSTQTTAVGQIATSNSGDIRSLFGNGLALGTGALTVDTGTGAQNIAAGTYNDATSLATAINTAAGSTVATVSSGELTITNSSTSNQIVFAGTAASGLGLGTTAVATTGATATSGTYQSGAISTFDFSAAQLATAGSYTTTAITLADYSTTSADFTIDGNAVSLSTDYTGGGQSYTTLAADIQTDLDASANGVYTVSVGGNANDQIVISKVATGALSTAPVYAAVANASDFTGGTSVAGQAATSTANATFTVDGNAVNLTTDYTNLAGLVSEIQSDLDTTAGSGIYTVTSSSSGVLITNASTGVGSTAPAIAGADAALITTGGTGTAGQAAGGTTNTTSLSTGVNSAVTAVGSTPLTLAAGAFTVQIGADTAVDLAGSYTTGQAFADAINAQVGGAFAAFDSTNGQLSVSSGQAVTFGGTRFGTGTNNLGFAAANVAVTNGSLASASVTTVANANNTILRVDAALTSVNSLRGALGAIQNRFESTITNLSTASENLTASRSRIQDADFAAETASLTRAQILQQAGTAILAQANAVPQNVLSLLR